MQSDNYDFSFIREYRKRRKMNAVRLAELSGISCPVISKLENNMVFPELSTVLKLAQVFGMTSSEFIAVAENRVARKSVATSHHSGSFTFSEVNFKNIRCLAGSAAAGGSLSKPEIHHDDFELCWVLKGKIIISLTSAVYTLNAGESIQFDALTEHSYQAVTDCEILIIHTSKN